MCGLISTMTPKLAFESFHRQKQKKKHCSTHPNTQSDVSIYGERQMLLRLFPPWLSFIIFVSPWLRRGSRDDGLWRCVFQQINTRIVTEPLHHSGAKNLQRQQKKRSFVNLTILMCVERVEIKIIQTRGSLAKENLRRWKFLISYVNSLTRETRDVKARRWNTTARFMTQSLFGNDFSSSRFRVFSALPGFVWLTTKNE